jgi:hypothetical protein
MEGEAILSLGGLRLYKSGSMRSFLDTKVNTERREGKRRSKTGSLGQSSKLAKFGCLEREQKAAAKLRSHQCSFHPGYCFLRSCHEASKPRRMNSLVACHRAPASFSHFRV